MQHRNNQETAVAVTDGGGDRAEDGLGDEYK